MTSQSPRKELLLVHSISLFFFFSPVSWEQAELCQFNLSIIGWQISIFRYKLVHQNHIEPGLHLAEKLTKACGNPYLLTVILLHRHPDTPELAQMLKATPQLVCRVGRASLALVLAFCICIFIDDGKL